MSHPLTLLLLAAGLMLLVFAALHDIAFRTVPNRISALLLFVGVLLRLQQGDLPAGLLCGVLMFAATYAFWIFGWIGAADTKLLSASSVFVPPSLLPTMVVAVSLAGGVLALIYILGSMFVPHAGIAPARNAGMLARIKRCELRRLRRRGPLPYAAAIATGSWLALTGS